MRGRDCDAIVRDRGFSPIPEWPSCYFHQDMKILLVIYVDDFLMSGPKESLPKAWEALRKGADDGTGIKMADPAVCDRFLGCHHIFANEKSPITGNVVSTCTFDMSFYMESCCQLYK